LRDNVRWLLLKSATCAGVPVCLILWICALLKIDLRSWPLAVQDTAWALLFAWLIDRSAHSVGGTWAFVLQLPVLRYVGRISYGLYVFHLLVGLIIKRWIPFLGLPLPSNRFAMLLLLSLTSAAFASLSWSIYERPFNTLKHRFSDT
jgi:peptidoglycan/LPS O-acetylase OafA/YrhL